MRRIAELIRTQEEALLDYMIAQVYERNEHFAVYRAKLSEAAFRTGAANVLRSIADDLDNGNGAFIPVARTIGSTRVALGFPITEMIRIAALGLEAISVLVERAFESDFAFRLAWERRRNRTLEEFSAALAETYVRSHEQIIRNQAAEMHRLSTPVLPVHPGILLAPFVGTVDEARASQMMLSLLEAVTKYASEVVIIDVTGVPVLDAHVGDYLQRTTQALRLVGAQVILVGINPKIAQILVAEGAQLDGVETLGDLEHGIEDALRLQGKAIRKRATGTAPCTA